MSFSAEVKENLSHISHFNLEDLEAEWLGYMISGNTTYTEDFVEFITENDFNIEHFYKILFSLEIEYEPEKRGKCYVAQMDRKKAESRLKNLEDVPRNLRKNIVKGAFLGAGCVNNPEKNYHLEIVFQEERQANFLREICQEFEIKFKKMKVHQKYQLYLKESEEISKFLALIGANKAVLRLEDVRVMKEMKNKINRKVNCETANLTKTVEASLKQIDDIHFIQKRKKFDELPKELKSVAILRLENPDLSLRDLSELLEPPIRKIGS